MTGRERVLCALRHEEPDHVPLSDNLWTDTLDRFRREGMPEDVAWRNAAAGTSTTATTPSRAKWAWPTTSTCWRACAR